MQLSGNNFDAEKKTTTIFVFLFSHFIIVVGIIFVKKTHDSSGTLKYTFYFITSRGEKLGKHLKYEWWKTNTFPHFYFLLMKYLFFVIYW